MFALALQFTGNMSTDEVIQIMIQITLLW